MKAVAMMTPEPKYLMMKKKIWGTRTRDCFLKKRGIRQPMNEPKKMTKIADMRKPMRPSYSLPASQSIVTVNASGSRLERMAMVIFRVR